ncbi:MAG: xanthine dehydrogenase family protein subunit M [Rhodoferax sp.]|nr:xanthine dehydrogenase family protein subunit M [Rhodoferax sp.]MCF8209498.1 xanthine dehydrogenase family protein subunit M [Rhodoferax sp.]
MKPAAFDYFRPSSLEQALLQLAACGAGAKVIAGGQSLGPMLNMRLAMPSALIDLNDLTEHAYIRDRGASLSIGALTRHEQIAESWLVQARCPLLAQAAKTIGHYAIRQRGTLGGSLAHADPAAQLPLIAMTLGAEIEMANPRGSRRLPASEFFLSVMSTALAADEIIHCVHFPTAHANEGSAFQSFSRRHGDYAIVAVATTVLLDQGRVLRVRLGLSGVDSTPAVCDAMVRPYLGAVGSAAWAADLATAVGAAVAPEDDARMPALYRKELTKKLVEQALLHALDRAKG